MISSILSRLPASKASDWKVWRVSICLAILASEGREIICVTDQKASFSGFSSDYLAVKGEPHIGGCAVLFAGNDAQYAGLILESAKDSLEPNSHPRAVADAIDTAYHEQLTELIERRVLKRFEFDGESFRKTGRRLCSDTQYARICERINKVELSLRFLVCGFDENGTGHLYTAGGKQSVEEYDHIGLWAIGEGDVAALSTLSFHISHQHISPPHSKVNETLAVALAAKFMAESENSVGKGTIVVVFEKDKKPQVIYESGTSRIREQWLKTGAPRMSSEMLDSVRTHLTTLR